MIGDRRTTAGGAVDGLMMEYPLTLEGILRRAETLFGEREVVSLTAGGAARRTTYGELGDRVRRLAGGLAELGIGPEDRVATLCMNHDRHLELYFGVPSLGAVLHTLNPRLPPDDIGYIVRDGGARTIVADVELVPVLGQVLERAALERVVVVGEGDLPAGAVPYEDLLAGPSRPAPADPDERRAAFLCYTSGTTGSPKGVLYSHRALVLHSLTSAMADALDVRETDIVMPVVPMFHVNAWGLPFTAAMAGAGQVLPGRVAGDPAGLVAAIGAERVTVSAGVPTVWLGVLRELDRGAGHDVSSLRTVIIGGSAAPQALIESLERRHGLRVLHAWGMTEMTPVGTVCRLPPQQADDGSEEAYRRRATQGRPIAFVEVRARGEEGLVPWDGSTMGELEVRGPAVAAAYFGASGDPDRFTEDGWFRTGDIVTIDPDGFVEITDRAKDLVKSGGEWISSVALENALVAHPDVAEAAVIAVPHPTWQERPLAVVVLADGATATPEDLLEHLRPRFVSWWLPDAIEIAPSLPHTATGKLLKSDLRERFAGRYSG
jgi:fatty-acyl-CoA synthase